MVHLFIHAERAGERMYIDVATRLAPGQPKTERGAGTLEMAYERGKELIQKLKAAPEALPGVKFHVSNNDRGA